MDQPAVRFTLPEKLLDQPAIGSTLPRKLLDKPALDLENRKQKGGLHLLDQLAVGSTLPGKLRSANKTRPSRQVFTCVQRKGAVERINEHQRAIAENDKSFWR